MPRVTLLSVSARVLKWQGAGPKSEDLVWGTHFITGTTILFCYIILIDLVKRIYLQIMPSELFR